MEEWCHQVLSLGSRREQGLVLQNSAAASVCVKPYQTASDPGAKTRILNAHPKSIISLSTPALQPSFLTRIGPHIKAQSLHDTVLLLQDALLFRLPHTSSLPTIVLQSPPVAWLVPAGVVNEVEKGGLSSHD